MKSNTHAKAIDEATLQKIVANLDDILQIIEPYVTPLTPHERQVLPKMGDKNLPFVEKSIELARENPMLVAPYQDINHFEIDFKDAHGLTIAVNKANQVFQALSDTQLCAGSEAFQSALLFYNTAKAAAANKVHGAKAVYEELRKRFYRPRRREEPGLNAAEPGTPE